MCRDVIAGNLAFSGSVALYFGVICQAEYHTEHFIRGLHELFG